jgi:hypothetical protein
MKKAARHSGSVGIVFNILDVLKKDVQTFSIVCTVELLIQELCVTFPYPPQPATIRYITHWGRVDEALIEMSKILLPIIVSLLKFS